MSQRRASFGGGGAGYDYAPPGPSHHPSEPHHNYQLLDRSRSTSPLPPHQNYHEYPALHHAHSPAVEAGLDYDERSQRVQQHMNTVLKHPKVKLELILTGGSRSAYEEQEDGRQQQQPIYEAGERITGRLELSCAASQKLRLGEIAVELEGSEGERMTRRLLHVSQPV